MDSGYSEVEEPAPQHADETSTGFRPDDAREPAPEHVVDAAATFSSISQAPIVKDAGGGALLTEEQQREDREELRGILRAQRIAETLTGVGGR